MKQPEFFTSDDLYQIKEWAGKPYDGSAYHKEVGEKLKKGPWDKTKYWTEEVAKRTGLDADIKRFWKNQATRFSDYTWGKVLDNSAWTQEIYFTLGINNGGNEEPFLHIKMDYHFNYPKSLSESQIERCKELIRPDLSTVFYETFIEISRLETMDWEQLLTETVDFIDQRKDNFYHALNEIGDVNPYYFTRICWNSNGWKNPSGREGKSSSKQSFEGITGMGMEEWLFSDDLQVDGYQYGFLQGVNQNNPPSEVFDADLYTVEDTDDGKLVYGVCSITGIQVIGTEETVHVQKLTGFDKKVERNLKKIKLPNSIEDDISSFISGRYLNVKFKLDNVDLPDSEGLEPLTFNLSQYPRYKLYEGKLFENKVESNSDQSNELDQLERKSGSRSKNKISKGKRSPGSYEIQHVHDEISVGIEQFLNAQKKDDEFVFYETPLGKYKAVDLVYEKSDEIIYYEIKTHPKLIFCIREGIGQLLEYGYYNRPEHNKQLKLVLVSTHAATEELRVYITKLREMSEFNIYYQQYDNKNKVLVDAV